MRHMDRVLIGAVRRGAAQAVLLGAGYDSRAYRLGERALGVDFFEVDHPLMSRRKRRKLRRIGAYGGWIQSEPVGWDDLRSLREEWDGPFMRKGVIGGRRHARRRDRGEPISVSNHGGNNPGRHAGFDPRVARDRRGGWEPDRGAPRRRDSARERRREGARARGPGGDDRPRLPMGTRRQRPGRRRERARHPPQRDRLCPARPGHSSVHDLSPADLLIPPRVTHGLEPADASVTSPA